jgi:hypothetical protein
MEEMRWPACLKCKTGVLCTSPDCGFNLRIDNGEISFGRAIGQSFK